MDNFDNIVYESLCKDILSKTKEYGATSAEVTLRIEAGFSVSSRLGQVETVEHHQDKGLGLTVYFDKQTGSASTTDLSMVAVENVIQKACDIAKYTNPDPYSGLADQSLMAFSYPSLDLDHRWNITAQDALEIAIDCENLAKDDPRITNSEGATVNSHRSLFLYANTHDFIGSYTFTQHSISCVLISQQNGFMHRDHDYTIARDPKDLKKIEELALSVREKTLNRLGARRIKTQSSPVIFTAETARSLIASFVNAISGNHIYRKSSFLVDRLGEQIFPTHINVKQNPHIPKAIGSAPFDNEGVRTQQIEFVKEGILKNYLLGSYSARKLGMTSTGNSGGVYNLFITNSNCSFEDLVKKMHRGFLVTELIGQGINLVTGDYSRGAFGYWIENGKIQYPVEEITIAGNLSEMFKNVIDVANDVDKRSRIQTGSILIENMMIAGK